MWKFGSAVAACGIVLIGQPALAGEVVIVVSGGSGANGELACRLYSSPEGFPEGEPVLAKQRVAAPGTCRFVNVPPGTYAVAVAMLQKGEASMPHDFLGRPKRPWGVSNNVRPTLRAPRFAEATFRVAQQGTVNIAIALSR